MASQYMSESEWRDEVREEELGTWEASDFHSMERLPKDEVMVTLARRALQDLRVK